MENRKVIKILIVEDNPDDVQLTKFALKKEKVDHQTFIAKDGEEAESFLSRAGKYSNMPIPDLVMLDLNLPKKNGFDILTLIKSTPSLKSLPVMILTTSANPDDIDRSYRGHANCYIQKPSDLKDFLTIVRNIKNFWLSTAILPPVKAF